MSEAWVLIEREHGIPVQIGPYPSHWAATIALQDSLLVDGFCEEDAIDAVVVTEPGDEVEVVVPDLTDPHHTGVDP